ncbi:MAG: hypothetical protein JW912_02870, partial [Sedimentisphaerales bacterium]|nr:hypothetical protein [Sedimentisphaerales bacterium]
IIFVMYIINPRDLYLKIGCMFLLINLLNLLPIYPLDGGRFVHLVLFSRNRFLELAMNIITAALLLILGFAIKSWFIKMLGFFNLLGISYKFKLAKKAKQLKSELIEAGPDMSDAEHQSDQIPEHILKHMITWIHQNMPGSMKPKTMADVALQLWERIKIHPPRVGATIILLVVFFIGYVFSFVSIGALAVSFYKNNGYSSEIIEYQKQDGTIGYKEQVSFMKKLSSETELSDDQQFYHGSHEEYGFDGKISAQGQWNMGTRADHWKHFDQDGSLIREVHYESGLPVLTKSLQDGKWHQNKWEDLSLQAKELHRQTAGFQQGPNKLPEYDYSKMIFDPNVVTSAPTLSVQ